MRDYVLLYINGSRHILRGAEVLLSLSDFLRKKLYLTGTKVVCAEGDCGACTVLRAFPLESSHYHFEAINACIAPVFLLDGSHIITVEGVQEEKELGPAQQSMVEHHGAQCGFCTPGMVMSLTQLGIDKENLTEQQVKNYLTGNLCRCTGYKGIIEAGVDLDTKSVKQSMQRYYHPDIISELWAMQKQPYHLKGDGWEVYAPTSYDEASQLKFQKSHLRPVASATDLGVLVNKDKMTFQQMISFHLISEAYQIIKTENSFKVGAKVSLKNLEKAVETAIPELARLLHVFASPQIKNIGTLIGNVANASPIGDTLPFLMVSGAVVELYSHRGSRFVLFNDFYLGYKKMDMGPDEFIKSIEIPILSKETVLKLYKVAKRKDLDISTVSAAFLLEKDSSSHTIQKIGIVYGGIAATPLRLKKVEALLLGQKLDEAMIEKAAGLLCQETKPLSDVRGTSSYRYMVIENLFRKFCDEIQSGANG